MSKFKFYLLSFTWGLPMTLIGCIVALVLIIAGYKPKKWGYCLYFEVGENWGGMELGIMFLTDKTPSVHTKMHEMGHGLQNCYLGPLMPFVVCIPSAVRYWLRNFTTYKSKTQYVAVLSSILFVLSTAVFVLGVLFNSLSLTIIACVLLFYVVVIVCWLAFKELPQYKDAKYIAYDSIWFEGDATKRGTELINKLGENQDGN